jgi:hypothetical protein
MDISVAASPGAAPTVRTVDYSTQTPFSSSATEAPFENFNPTNLFDLDMGCIEWRPNARGGFDVTYTRGATSLNDGQVAGTVLDNQGMPVANCRVRVRSSQAPAFEAWVTSNELGRFRISALPRPGGITIDAYEADSSEPMANAVGVLLGSGEPLSVQLLPTRVSNKN